jgi:hypothetical protein
MLTLLVQSFNQSTYAKSLTECLLIPYTFIIIIIIIIIIQECHNTQD